MKPFLIALALVFVIAGATPLVAGTWNIVGIAIGTGVIGGLLLIPNGDRRYFVAGSVVGGLLLFAGVIGAVQQNVVNGDAQLRGSRLDRAVRTERDIERSVEILVANQRLLGLLPEQSIGLMGNFTAAADQAVSIAERWNPATNTDIPTAGLEALMVEVNLAAARQAAAFSSHIANLENSEPGIAAQAARLKTETETMLNGPVASAMAAARQEIWGEEQAK